MLKVQFKHTSKQANIKNPEEKISLLSPSYVSWDININIKKNPKPKQPNSNNCDF